MLRLFVLMIVLGLSIFTAKASENEKKEFNISETLFHHILDTHNWHICDLPKGGGEYITIEIPMPWIIYHPQKGLDYFFLAGHQPEIIHENALEKGYAYYHEHLYAVDPFREVIDPAGNPNPEFVNSVMRDEHGHWVPASSEKLKSEGIENSTPVVMGADHKLYALNGSIKDLSITKTVFQMMLVAILMLLIFRSVAKSYERNRGKAPSGLQSLLEPVIVFVQEEISKPYLKNHHARFTPYLLTLFFFIWFSNLLGLTPLNANIAGNIAVTAALSLLTLIITNFNGTKDYWQHIFWFPGVPFGVKLIMLPVELIGIITKPFSLTIRLFANISAGHFMILSLISLIFLLGKSGENVAGAIGILPLSFAFTLFIMTLEILVAVLQAFVFTLLTAVFIGQALESHDHHEEAHH